MLEAAAVTESAAARGWRRVLKKDLAAELKKRDREKLAKLRSAIEDAKRARKARYAEARELCRREREAVRERLREERRRVMQELRDEHAAERAAARSACRARRQEIKQGARSELRQKKALLAEERRLQRELARAERRYDAKKRARSTSREREQEDDDRVRSNLPPELVPVFDRVRRRIKGGPRRTRTEAFLEWAQENPSEVIAIQSENAEDDVQRLIREHEQLERAMQRGARYRKPKREMEAMLEEVPF